MTPNELSLRAQLEQISSKLHSLLHQEEYLTIEEAAAFLKVSRTYLYKEEHRENIPCIKKGQILRFRKSDLIAFLESGLQNPVKKTNSI